MDDWEKINKNSLPEKEDFPSHLNIEDIIHVDYAHKKGGCRGFEIKNLGKYHHWYVQNDALLLAGVFENFRNIYLKTYVLDPAKFTASPRLAYQAA